MTDPIPGAGFDRIRDCLAERVTDPMPAYLFRKDVLREDASCAGFIEARERVRGSRWYLELAREQRENGSWGRFHTQDTKDPVKRRFVTTEAALKRGLEIGLDREDPLICAAIRLMERYLTGEEAWPDTNEKHFGFEIAFRTILAANLTRFDPENPLIASVREACVLNLRKAFAGGVFREDVWEGENRRDRTVLLRAYMVYPLWLVQTQGCMEDELQRRYLHFIWNRSEGIYYISSMPPACLCPPESKAFPVWLSALENLSGFSLFPEFMAGEAAPHLIREAERLMRGEAPLPPAPPMTGHYAENWRGKEARAADMVLRIARILAKC